LIVTDVSGKNIGPTFKGQAVQEDWPLKIGEVNYPEISVTINIRCVTSQKRENFIYIAAEV
jgi:hypothetical protein